MNESVLRVLRCPVCAARTETDNPLSDTFGSLTCARGHSFDIARQGYVNLAAGRNPHSGDTAEMVAAREAFLSAGHFDFVIDALAEWARTAYPGTGVVVDAGAGTGRHLAGVLACMPGVAGLALDVSKPALRRAARAHPDAAAALCDTWGRLPLADGAAGLVLNVFAPRNGEEFRRILRPGGRLLVVTPEPDHLGELVAALGLLTVDPEKPARLAASLTGWRPAGEDVHTRRLTLSRAEAATLVAMGPSAWHAGGDTGAMSEPIEVTASVRITAWQPQSD